MDAYIFGYMAFCSWGVEFCSHAILSLPMFHNTIGAITYLEGIDGDRWLDFRMPLPRYNKRANGRHVVYCVVARLHIWARVESTLSKPYPILYIQTAESAPIGPITRLG